MATLCDTQDTVGKPIECKAAIAWAANQPLDVTTVTVDPPQVLTRNAPGGCCALALLGEFFEVLLRKQAGLLQGPLIGLELVCMNAGWRGARAHRCHRPVPH